MTFQDLTEWLVTGGWPGYQQLPAEDVSRNLADYLDTVAMVDLPRVDGAFRDPSRVSRLIKSLARSVATEVSIPTLSREEKPLSRDTVRDYLTALEHIVVVENQLAWSVHFRSSATLRKEPKRHLADPSLATDALNPMPEALQVVSSGPSYRRTDEVNVVAIGALGP